MEQPVFNLEAFNRTIVLLKQLANIHQPRNDQAIAVHNEAYFAQGEEVSGLLTDVARVADPEQVGKAIVEFISTIPGVATENMLGTVCRSESIALSDRAVSALLRRNRGGEVGMSLTFAYEGWPKHKLEFERLDPNHNRFAVNVKIGLDGVPIDGEIKIGTTDGQAVFNKHSIHFDSNGIVLEGSLEYDLRTGEKLNIIQIIQQVTSPDNLGNPINASEMISKVKPLKIEE